MRKAEQLAQLIRDLCADLRALQPRPFSPEWRLLTDLEATLSFYEDARERRERLSKTTP